MYPRLAGFIPQPDSPSYNRPVVIYEAAVRHAHRPELRRRAPFALCYPDFIGTVLAGTPGWVRPANSASRLGTVSGQVSRLVGITTQTRPLPTYLPANAVPNVL